MTIIDGKGFKAFRSATAFLIALIMIVSVFVPGVVTYAEGNEDEEEAIIVEVNESDIDDGTETITETDTDDADNIVDEEIVPGPDIGESDNEFDILGDGDESDDEDKNNDRADDNASFTVAIGSPLTENVLAAATDEDFDVAKTLISGGNGNTGLIEKEFKDCNVGIDHELIYQIDVTTTGNGKSSGRVHQEEVLLDDTISGLVAAPNSITISTNNTFGDADDITLDNTDFTYAAGTCIFAIPVLNSPAVPFVNQSFWVKVIVEEDDYTAMYGAAGAITEAVTINNSVYLEIVPMTSPMEIRYYEFSVDAYLGFRQNAPSSVNLVIQKQVSINGAAATDYITALQGIYGDSANPVAFTLTPTTGITVSGAIDENGRVTLAVEPNTGYTLTESKGISSMFTKAGAVEVVVGSRKFDGTCDIAINGVAYDGAHEVVNTTATAASIKVICQTNDMHTNIQANVPDGHEVYVQLNGTTIKTGTTKDGVVVFEGLEAGVEYTITGAGIVEFTTPVVSVTPECGDYSDSRNTYSLIFIKDGGGFILNKRIMTIGGEVMAFPSGHTATFELVKMDGAAPSENPADKHTITYPTDVDTSTGVVNLILPAGTYQLKEISSTPVGQYKDNNKTATVTIEVGRTDAMLSGDAISGGFFINTTNYSAGTVNYRLVYDGNGTTINVPSTVVCSGGATITVAPQIPVREGYVFKGWNRESAAVNNAGDTFTMPHRDVVLVAIWEQAPTDLTLMLSKVLRDAMDEQVGSGTSFRVQIFDSAMNLFADVIVPANGASIPITGLVAGETYTVREIPGEGFELQGYQLGGQFVSQETVSFVANNTESGSGIISLVVCNVATNLEDIVDPGDSTTDLSDIPPLGDDDGGDVIIISPEDSLTVGPGSPKTGDSTNIGIYIGIMVAAIALIALLIPTSKRHKKNY